MGKTAVIIGNGQFPRKEYPLYILSQADYIVCCDGAFRRYMKHVRDSGSGRLPDAIVGDMDSLSAADQAKYSHTNLPIVDLTRHEPAELCSWNCAGRSPLKQRKDDATKKNGTETLSSTFRIRWANGASIPYNGLA